ncbi:3-deoxy-manno-octulosonate cytidylyltransferase [Duodenibacillus massiliensis]|jgi:3-deoxy-D-manno-octulosonate cytidylyltransferase|uniref:3-deoxy-manno-octulosonate cytidylyltransferase n=1 Tax=Duodenibacillus massiliensis TaxID=1852381 RepID=UPI003079E5A6|nr:3-deoxy-manno-octulosonate cytidylyltransferase [Sutterella sp.]
MSFAVIIPARMHSTRLPNKPLMDIAGKPMVVRVAERAALSGASRVAVATDHDDIVKACTENGIEAVLTKETHPTGTDRLSEAATLMGLADDTIVVNVQGDEPLIPPEVVGRVAKTLEEAPDCAIATATHPIETLESFLNPNVVKVELDGTNRAMTFSRAPIPWPRDAFKDGQKALPQGFTALHHIGIYAYRVAFLKRFPALTRAPIEAAESLEQLRAMWHGYKIAVTVLSANLPAGVDTAEDLERVRRLWPAA